MGGDLSRIAERGSRFAVVSRRAHVEDLPRVAAGALDAARGVRDVADELRARECACAQRLRIPSLFSARALLLE